MFLQAVVVACDDARPNIRSLVDFGVAKIGKVTGLYALMERSLFGLDKVAQMNIFANAAAWA